VPLIALAAEPTSSVGQGSLVRGNCLKPSPFRKTHSIWTTISLVDSLVLAISFNLISVQSRQVFDGI